MRLRRLAILLTTALPSSVGVLESVPHAEQATEVVTDALRALREISRRNLEAGLSDHGVLRLLFRNAHWITDELVRTNQPWPHQLATWSRAGVRTVINLRGPSESAAHILEREACDRLGLTLIDFRLSSKTPPSAKEIGDAQRLFETITYPALIHCKSGIDRSGMMSALYLHFRHGAPIARAIEQLGPRYLYFGRGRAGVLRHMLAHYVRAVEPTSITFADWVASDDYQPHALAQAYAAQVRGLGLQRVFARRA